MAEHHTCDRCGDPIEGFLLNGNDRFVWLGTHVAAELDLKCLNAVETVLFGQARTFSLDTRPGEPGFSLGRWLRARLLALVS